MGGRRKRSKPSSKAATPAAGTSVKKWKEIEEEDIKEDGLTTLKKGDPIKWNTYRSVPDFTRWKKISDTNAYKVVNNADLQSALATAFGDKVNSHDNSGSCKVSSQVVRNINMPNNGMVQIPFRTDSGMEVVAFRPETRLEIPDDPIHTIQRRTHRWASVTPTEQQTSSILASATRVNLSDTEELYKSKKHGKPCIVLCVKKGDDVQEDVVWP